MRIKYVIYIAAVVVLAAAAFGALSPPVEDFAFSCTYAGLPCTLVSDNTTGICRTINYGTIDGPLGVQLCHKDDSRYELYRQFYPLGKDFKVCTADGAGCIDQVRGFDSFTTKEFCFTPNATTDYCFLPLPKFPVSCAAPNCDKFYDNTVGTCRTVRFKSSIGKGQILACHKGDSRYEVYWQGGNFQMCFGPGCVTPLKGYDSFEVSCKYKTLKK